MTLRDPRHPESRPSVKAGTDFRRFLKRDDSPQSVVGEVDVRASQVHPPAPPGTHWASVLLLAWGTYRGAEKPKRKYRYVDIHTHVGRYYRGKDLTVAGLLKLMDKHEIERACVLPLVSPESTIYPQTSDDALAAFRCTRIGSFPSAAWTRGPIPAIPSGLAGSTSPR